MKNLLLIFILLLALNAHVFAGENGSSTKEEWIAFIRKDAKLSSLEAVLGPPDDKKVKENTRCDWRGKLDVGTTHPRDLRVLASPYKGELIIWAIWDPVTDESYTFPWADKVRGGL